MATPIKRIEKDFLLKVLYDEQIPLMYFKHRSEYIMMLERPVKNELVLRPDRPIDKLKARHKLDLMFDYRGQVILFSVEVSSIKENLVFCEVPEQLFKNLDRSYSRISSPSELEVQFTFLGDRYNLSFPKVTEFENESVGDFVRNINPRNLSGLIGEMAEWIKGYASGYKLVIFKDVKPESIEERIVAETGKSFYLPSTLTSFPQSDPYPRKRIITEETFKFYLESTGVEQNKIDETCARFIRMKHNGGIFSDLWVPLLFQEYVIGYIHIWISRDRKLPFDYKVIDAMYQFAKVLSYSLKLNGYFEQGKMRNDPFAGKVIDISVSGMLFTCPQASLFTTMMPESELMVKLITPRRTLELPAKIVRRYKDNAMGYIALQFHKTAPEDVRFLFEFLYGKPFTETDADFLAGQV